MKSDKVLCCMFFSFLALTLHKTQKLFTTDRGTNQWKRFGYVIHAYCMNAKQKIVHGRKPSNINLCFLMFSGLRNHFPLRNNSLTLHSLLIPYHVQDTMGRGCEREVKQINKNETS